MIKFARITNGYKLLAATVLAVTVSAQAHAAAGDTPIRVNGQLIEKARIDRAEERLAAAGVPAGEARRHAARQEMIAREAMLQAAAAQGLEQDPEVQQAVREAREAAMIARMIARSARSETITDAHVRSEYMRTVGAMGANEYKARMIQLADPAEAAKVAGELRAKQLSFEQAAKRYSKAGSAALGGELSWAAFKTPLVEGETFGVPVIVASTIMALRPGETSDVIADSKGLFIVKLEAMRKARIPTYEEAAPTIRRMLEGRAAQKAATEFSARLIANTRVEQ